MNCRDCGRLLTESEEAIPDKGRIYLCSECCEKRERDDAERDRDEEEIMSRCYPWQ